MGSRMGKSFSFLAPGINDNVAQGKSTYNWRGAASHREPGMRYCVLYILLFRMKRGSLKCRRARSNGLMSTRYIMTTSWMQIGNIILEG